MDIREWLGEDNQIGYDIWTKKYQHEDESFEEWLDRISGGDEELRELIKQKKFLFGGRILSNRGLSSEEKVTYSNCYVITPPQDNLESIYSTASKLARTYSYGGGCGIDISLLSPAGAKVRNQAKKTTGAVSFMPTFNEVTKTIGQNGRRGALMISIDCTHPDLPEFIDIKAQNDSIEHANISIKVSDDFMQAVIDDSPWKMEFTRKETGEKIVRYEQARDLFKKIAKNNWNWAEPGFLYWNRISNYNLLQYEDDFEYAGLNPCAEEPLPAGGSCLLGSINLSAYVKQPFTKEAHIDVDELMQDVYVYVRALNTVLDEGLSKHPLQEQRKAVEDWRQIGLGLMGLADALIKSNIAYGSNEAIDFVDSVGYIIAIAAITASSEIAKHKGTYNKFSNNVYDSDFYKTHIVDINSDLHRDIKKYGLRNSQLLTCAPTGSIATMLGISTGIEPLFAKSWERKTESLHGEDKYYVQYPTVIQEAIQKTGCSIEELDDILITAHDLQPLQRIKMQSALQKHIDASISSTINLPYEATAEDIEQIYIDGWKYGLKGITVYREGSAKGGILVSQENKTPINEENDKISSLPKRGEVMDIQDDKVIGLKKKLVSGCVDAETEYFNGKEWKKISDYVEGELVLQYNLDGTANLVKPLNYIKRPSQGQYHIVTKYGLDMMVSPDHRNVTFLKDNKPKIMTTQEIMNTHENTSAGFARKFKVAFNYDGPGINLSDEEIRLSVAIFADGCFYSPTSKKCLVSIKKKRKRDRLIDILEQANIEYSEHIGPDGYYNIKFYPPLDGVKTFPTEWYNCSQHQLKVIFDEVFHWDGYDKRNNEYTTIYKSNADFVQFVCASLGFQGSIYKDNRAKNTVYRVDWSSRILRSFATQPKREIPFIMPKDGYDYCFSVPSTMLVLRRNDKIFVTGNCGSLHCAAYFDVETGDLREIYLSKGSTGGCVDADTEYFNGTEWKPISQYVIGSEEKVLQYNLNGTAELVLPNAYIENENVDSLYHFYNSYGMDMVLSEDHRMFTYKNYRKYKAGIRPNLTYEIMTVNEYIEREGSKERHIPTTFNYAGRGIPLSNELIRLLVAIYADGTWDGHKIVISLKKERKKERLEKLLEESNIGYSKRDINNTEYTRYCLYPSPKERQWFIDKQFTNKWLECTDEQAKIVIDECVYWDGSIPEGNRLGEYYSSKKEEIDILQFLLARLGYRGTISDNTGSSSAKPSYRLRWTKRNVHNLKYATIEKYPTKDGKSYCFNVPSGLLVLRRNNKIFITGNCANFMTGLSRMISMSARAGVKIHDIVDQLMSTGVCPSYATRTKTKHDTSKGSCCPMAIGYALQEMWEEFNGIKMGATKRATERTEIVQEKIKKEETKNIPLCPDCGAPLTFEGGCNICKECGYSKCD